MPDLTKAREVTHGVDDIVRSLAFGLVDDQSAVERRGLRLFWHEIRSLEIRTQGLEDGLSFFISFRSCSMRSTCSCERSSVKCSSGRRRSCNRSMISLRIYPEACSSALMASVCSLLVP